MNTYFVQVKIVILYLIIYWPPPTLYILTGFVSGWVYNIEIGFLKNESQTITFASRV